MIFSIRFRSPDDRQKSLFRRLGGMWNGGAGWVFGLRPVGLFALGAARWRVGFSESGWALFWGLGTVR